MCEKVNKQVAKELIELIELNKNLGGEYLNSLRRYYKDGKPDENSETTISGVIRAVQNTYELGDRLY